MTEERFGQQVGGMIREFDPVPDTPVEEIWMGVQAARRNRRPQPLAWRRPSLVWALSVAATLVLGIAIGRSWTPQPGTMTTDSLASASGAELEAPPEFRMAAADYLASTQALLTAFPSGAREGRGQEVAAWARQLLLDTRLLMDSPAAVDPQLHPLLSDLELVLAQIAAIRVEDEPSEIELIEDGIQQNRVLARLRVAAGAAAGVNGDD